MPIARRQVIATAKAIGFHAYAGAPHVVAYLESRHRHEFTFKVAVDVTHDNRDVEFHILQQAVHEALAHRFEWLGDPHRFEFGNRSCEMIAVELAEELFESGLRSAWIEVWEDGENGGRVEFAFQ